MSGPEPLEAAKAGFARRYPLPFAGPSDFGLFADPEKTLRLGPQWDVKSFERHGDAFTLEAEFDRSEQTVLFTGRIEAYEPGRTLSLSLVSDAIRLVVSLRLEAAAGGGWLDFFVDSAPDADPEDLREYDLWARSLLNYLGVSRSRSPFMRAWKWFLDRWWLKMPQSGKRILFFVLAGEALSFVFLVAILLWWRFVSSP